ncbi:MAG: c-type cytochrome [Alphaproteobacteria bacterium]|nr:c-type cytochrome [Alphaproteobacteria bacterium]
MMAVAVLLANGPALAAGDPAKGKRIFNKCKACHHLDKNKHKVGPTLAGLIGRTAGTATDGKSKLFRYSKAMKKAGANGIVWNAENLDKYLTKPKAFIPKNKMTFPGLKKLTDRANVIAYIESQEK